MFTIGDVLPFAATVKDAAGVLANAGTMTLTVTLPDGTAAVGSPFTVTPTSTGLYDKDVTSTQAGRYHGYWQATGANAGGYEEEFVVAPADSGTFVRLAEAKTHLNAAGITTNDVELEHFLQAACARIEYEVGPVARRTVTSERQRHEYGRATIWLHQAPVISVTTVTSVATGGTTVTVADLDVDPDGRITYKDGYTRFPAGLYLWTYVAGRVIIPAPITLATKELVRHLWRSQRGATGLPLQGGEDVYVPTLPFALPNGVRELLAPYMRAPAVA
jgi:hypothetical protein